jgi:hypothetical protein
MRESFEWQLDADSVIQADINGKLTFDNSRENSETNIYTYCNCLFTM